MHPLVGPLALLVERIVGYPRWLLDAVGHPVMWMGKLIDRMEEAWNRPGLPPDSLRLRGIAMLLALVLAGTVPAMVIATLLAHLPYGWLAEALLATAFLAQKELDRAVAAVAEALDRSLAEGRKAVSGIVGRDVEALDEGGVSRAALESLAESASDGVIAPLFWLMLLGLPGVVLYKAVNTADSMVGHRTERFRHFGWASARLDDALNFVPARLTALLIAGAAFFVAGASPVAALAAARADAKKHDSPNAGWPEAALAGALGLSLGGPRAYGGDVLDLPAFGAGRRELGPAEIRAGLRLYRAMLWLALMASLVIAGLAIASSSAI